MKDVFVAWRVTVDPQTLGALLGVFKHLDDAQESFKWTYYNKLKLTIEKEDDSDTWLVSAPDGLIGMITRESLLDRLTHF